MEGRQEEKAVDGGVGRSVVGVDEAEKTVARAEESGRGAEKSRPAIA